MEIITEYWEQLSAFVLLVVLLILLSLDIDVLKDKVKLEEDTHPPVDWNNKIEVHERAIQDLYNRLQELENKLRKII